MHDLAHYITAVSLNKYFPFSSLVPINDRLCVWHTCDATLSLGPLPHDTLETKFDILISFLQNETDE